jgi:hypothetical protein
MKNRSIESYSLEEMLLYRDIPELFLNFSVKQLIRGESLAEPKLNYQNTSSFLYKTKKFNLQKEVSNLQKAIKIIDSFFMKLSINLEVT